ncbi:hypothetical protein EDC01DRAFT_631877 [Geopyxis carbonaria]|nr:hypothetical protein EDC01DRAFT_631877 [Geopyxis carbonaria]
MSLDPSKPNSSPSKLQPSVSEDVEISATSSSITNVELSGTGSDEIPPPQPPRPISLEQKNQNTLEEVFPTIEAAIIKAVLVASGGQLDPAFNALLSQTHFSCANGGMSDPSAVEQSQTQSPLPDTSIDSTLQIHAPVENITTTPRDQLNSDALYAQRLQEQYGDAIRQSQRVGNKDALPPTNRHRNDDSDNDDYYYDSDKDHSFFDDDLPVIKENIRKGFMETQTKVNSWFMDFKKRIDGDSPENSHPTSGRPVGHSARSAGRTITSGEYHIGNQRSRDSGYDADPAVLSDDFTHLGLKDKAASDNAPPRRQKANPNLFEPSRTVKSGARRTVSFEDRSQITSDEELYRPGSTQTGLPSTKKNDLPGSVNKWEPLKSVDPAPMDRDPFSLGDSDDEKDGLVKEVESVKTTSVTGPQESGVTKTK